VNRFIQHACPAGSDAKDGWPGREGWLLAQPIRYGPGRVGFGPHGLNWTSKADEQWPCICAMDRSGGTTTDLTAQDFLAVAGEKWKESQVFVRCAVGGGRGGQCAVGVAGEGCGLPGEQGLPGSIRRPAERTTPSGDAIGCWVRARPVLRGGVAATTGAIGRTFPDTKQLSLTRQAHAPSASLSAPCAAFSPSPALRGCYCPTNRPTDLFLSGVWTRPSSTCIWPPSPLLSICSRPSGPH
jgi:hypothetical protein